MGNNDAWIQKLGINTKDYSHWLLDKPKDVSASFWCLKNKRIDQNLYLNWAKNHYQLPVMNNNFKDFKGNFTMWEQLKSVANWSEAMVPLYFWKNTLFILVTEPLDNNWSFPVKYILGTPEQLQFFWNKLNSKNSPLIQEAQTPIKEIKQESVLDNQPPPPMPATVQVQSQSQNQSQNQNQTLRALETDVSKINNKQPAVDKNLNTTAANSEAPPCLSEVKVSNYDGLEGLHDIELNDSHDEFGLDNLDPSIPLFQVKEADHEMQPEGLFTDALPNNLESTSSQPEGILSLKSKEAPDAKDSKNEPSSKQESTSTELNELFEGASENKTMHAEQKPEHTEPMSLQSHSPNAVDTQREDDFMADSLAPHATEESEVIEDSDIDSFLQFNQSNKDFTKCLALTLEDNQLKVTKQDGNWNISDHTPITFTQAPSLIKYCLISNKLFHGKVSHKDSLKSELFKKLNISNDFEHITVVPVPSRSSAKKFVLFTGEQSNFPALERLEKLTKAL